MNSRYEISPDEVAIHIKRMRESNPLVFSTSIDSLDVEECIIVMPQNLELFLYPRALKWP